LTRFIGHSKRVKRDVDRARATVRHYVGDKILVTEEVQDGVPVMTSRTRKGALEAAFLRAARRAQTNLVAGACYALSRSNPQRVRVKRMRASSIQLHER